MRSSRQLFLIRAAAIIFLACISIVSVDAAPKKDAESDKTESPVVVQCKHLTTRGKKSEDSAPTKECCADSCKQIQTNLGTPQNVCVATSAEAEKKIKDCCVEQGRKTGGTSIGENLPMDKNLMDSLKNPCI